MRRTTSEAARIHRSALVIDTHADTPQRFLDEQYDLAGPRGRGDLDLATVRRGHLGAEFFSIWVEPQRFRGQYARRTLELIDAVRRQVAAHPDRVALATSPDGIASARSARKLAALMGIEGGHSIENSLALLRLYYALGVRYMTLTWSNSNDWADSSGDLRRKGVPHTRHGLTAFGESVVREMNRLGMMVDLSHVADRTFYRARAISRAPVIASHSGARALCDHPRNMTDDMLRAVARSGGPRSKGGVVQVIFFSGFLSQAYCGARRAIWPEANRAVARAARRARAHGRVLRYLEEEKIRRGFMDRLPRPPFSVLIDHIDHVARVAGVDHVGLGSDFDGMSGQMPQGLDSPADLPKITHALLDRGYTAEECRKILGGNLLRVFREIEAVSRSLDRG
ncbi:MAG TPA: dipeptidase [Thermoplasmata archaeon]|nr:dipeptidase [Thermoplasmata archaeon]